MVFLAVGCSRHGVGNEKYVRVDYYIYSHIDHIPFVYHVFSYDDILVVPIKEWHKTYYDPPGESCVSKLIYDGEKLPGDAFKKYYKAYVGHNEKVFKVELIEDGKARKRYWFDGDGRAIRIVSEDGTCTSYKYFSIGNEKRIELMSRINGKFAWKQKRLYDYEEDLYRKYNSKGEVLEEITVTVPLSEYLKFMNARERSDKRSPFRMVPDEEGRNSEVTNKGKAK